MAASDPMTSQLLLAVKARDAFRIDADGLLPPRVASVFPVVGSQPSQKV